LAFSPDGNVLYLSDSPTARIEAWDLEKSTGALSNRRVFATLAAGEGYSDGAAVDADGGYWTALVYGAAVRRYRADGSVDRTLSLPFSNPTNIAFGGPDLRTLFVTTTRMTPASGKPNMGDQMLGAIFAFDIDVAGLPDPMLK
jgi:L-arabinonolactonase